VEPLFRYLTQNKSQEIELMELIISSLDELDAAAEKLIAYADGRQKMAFYAEIGAGKTTFIQAICKRLKVVERVTSPTFSLINEYSCDDGKGTLVYHIDLYRLNSTQEALDIGIEDYLYQEGFTFVEWPDLVEKLLPTDVIRINIEILDNSTRKILFL